MNTILEIFEIVLLTIMVSGGATLLAIIWGIPLGVFIGLKKFRFKSTIKGFFSALMGLPAVSLGLLLFMLLSRRGPLGFLHLLFTPGAIILGQAILITPIIISLIANTVESVDPMIRELALTLGASDTQASITVLRESKNGVVLAIVTSFNRAIAELGVALMLGGNILGVTRILTPAIALETIKGDFESAIAFSIILLAIVFTLNMIINKVQKRGQN